MLDRRDRIKIDPPHTDHALKMPPSRLPVRRNGLQEGAQVGGADFGNGGGEEFRITSEARESRVSAVGGPHDHQTIRISDAFIHRPANGIHQVILHSAVPLALPGQKMGLAEAGRSSVVDAEHVVAAIRQQLMERVESPEIPGLRAAMNQQHQRLRP